MPIPIIIYYHCLFSIEDQFLPSAVEIVMEQMAAFKQSGLADSASEFHVGINSGEEGAAFAGLFPEKATLTFHGIQCRNELRTILMIEERLKTLDGEAYLLYTHAKGCTHPDGDYLRTRWRSCMMRNLVHNWRTCIIDLDKGYESVGCHFMQPPATPPKQYIFGGNFWWSRASYLRTLPSVMERERIKISGLDSLESRFESEVWLGNGPRPPRIKDYHPNWDPGKISTCTA